MILSNVEIHQAIDDGRLVITPEPLPRLPKVGEHWPYDTHTVNLTLSPNLSIPKTGPYCNDLSKKQGLSDFLSDNSEKIVISSDQPYELKRDRFILGQTVETINLPLDGFDEKLCCLAARIEGKSSRARLGMLVHFTAPTVHPGYDGTLTLEIINLGPVPILLHPGVAIAQLIVEEVRGIPIESPSRFQGQSSPEGVLKK